MTREDAIKTLKENSCAMCAYFSKDMDSCDIRSCDNKDAIKALERESCDDAIKYFNIINELSETLGVSYDFVDKKIKEAVTTFKALPQEPCTDAISRQAAIDACLNGWNKGYKEIVEEIRALPPVTAEKVGHWISNAEDDLKISEYTCSNCKGLSDEDSDFCPKCGSYNGGAE